MYQSKAEQFSRIPLNEALQEDYYWKRESMLVCLVAAQPRSLLPNWLKRFATDLVNSAKQYKSSTSFSFLRSTGTDLQKYDPLRPAGAVRKNAMSFSCSTISYCGIWQWMKVMWLPERKDPVRHV